MTVVETLEPTSRDVPEPPPAGNVLIHEARLRQRRRRRRVAVAGLGDKGRHHLKMLLEIPNVRVVALCDHTG